MKCYFCRTGASVTCICGRCVCNTHSKRVGGKFLCFECAMVGKDEAKPSKVDLQHSGECCVCHTKEFLRPCGGVDGILEGHYLCKDHYPKRSVRTLQTSLLINSIFGGEIRHSDWIIARPRIDEHLEFECPCCKSRWTEIGRCIQKEEGKMGG